MTPEEREAFLEEADPADFYCYSDEEADWPAPWVARVARDLAGDGTGCVPGGES